MALRLDSGAKAALLCLLAAGFVFSLLHAPPVHEPSAPQVAASVSVVGPMPVTDPWASLGRGYAMGSSRIMTSPRLVASTPVVTAAPPPVVTAAPPPVVTAAPPVASSSSPAPLALPAGPAAPSIQALQKGEFEVAGELAEHVLQDNGEEPYALLVRVVTRYKKVAQKLMSAMGGPAPRRDAGPPGAHGFEGLATEFEGLATEAEAELALMDADLALIARDASFAVELCPACWQVDWNGDGHIDARDQSLLEIVVDDRGSPLPPGDPRRRPTFRFDHGDVLWAQAFVGFQRALLDVAMAYDWSSLGNGLAMRSADRTGSFTIRLVHPQRMALARVMILRGLAFSEASRVSYLAETDDDREWMPGPHQRSHPMPLPVNEQLYATWKSVVGDVRRLVQGEEVLRVSELVALDRRRWSGLATASINLHSMLSRPRDLVLDVEACMNMMRQDDAAYSLAVAQAGPKLFGAGYTSGGKPSPLPGRLARMRQEIDAHSESFERKLRYLFWIN